MKRQAAAVVVLYLAALVAIREDIRRVKGRNKTFAWES